MAQPRRRIPPGKCPYLGGLRMPPRRRAKPPEWRREGVRRTIFPLRKDKTRPKIAKIREIEMKIPTAKAAPRRAGSLALPTEAGSRTGDSRPSSLGERSRKGKPLPGFRRQRRKESESFFPATRAAGKILLTERHVGTALAGPAPKRSAIATGGTPGLARGNGGAISTKHLTERHVGTALAGPAPKRSAIATGGTPGLTRGNGSAISPKHYTERSVAARPPLGGLAAAPERSDWPSSQRPGGAETGPSRWRKSPWRF